MASIPLTFSAVKNLKSQLRHYFPELGSSQLTEALAAALGFNTNAALHAEIRKQATIPLYRLLSEEAFDQKLSFSGDPALDDFNFEYVRTPEMLFTECLHADKFDYKSTRQRAWRNLIVCAVNEALKRGLFSLKPSQNYWPGFTSKNRKGFSFDFNLPCDLPARVAIGDAGFEEILIHVAVNPIGDTVPNFELGLLAGDAVAGSWLEREEGAWLQSCDDNFHCRPNLIPLIAGINVQPFGYGDRGRLIM